MQLYGYWRSSAAYRVRIALNLKGVPYEHLPVHLVKDGGQQHAPEYVRLNPAHLVPSLVLEDGTVLTQSLAIIDYLDRTYPDPALLPADPVGRAHAMAVAHAVAMDIHPVNNLRVLERLSSQFGADGKAKRDWMVHWMTVGFAGIEPLLAVDTAFAFGDTPGLADICITSQLYNARRWEVDLRPFPRLTQIEQTCLKLPAVAAATPDQQPDAA